MSSIKINASIDDRQVRQLFRQLIERGQNPRPAFQEIGEAMILSTEDRFRAERDPDGNRWQALSPRYRRRKKGHKILTERSRLRNSIIYRAMTDQVEWGTNVIYAAIHQLGGTIKHATHSTDMPARPYLGLSGNDRETIISILNKHLLG